MWDLSSSFCNFMKQDAKFLPLCLLLKEDREINFEKLQLLYRGADMT